MRVAFLSHFYPPMHNAGIEQYGHTLAKVFRANGNDVHVLCCGTWSEGDQYYQGTTEDIWEGIPVRRLHINWTKAPYPLDYLDYNPFLLDHVRKFLKDYQPDIVHVLSLYTLSTSCLDACKELGLPVVFTMSDFWITCPRHTLLKYDGENCDGVVSSETCQDCLLRESRAYRLAHDFIPDIVLRPSVQRLMQNSQLRKSIPGLRGWGRDIQARRAVMRSAVSQIDHFIAPSGHLRDTILKVFPDLPIEVVPHGNDLTWLQSFSPRIPDGDLHFGYIGQITSIKGLHILIQAFQAGGFPDHVHLYIYGKCDPSSEYFHSLKSLANQNSNIHFMGGYLRQDLPAVLSNIDVLIVPSIWQEVAGLVVQEAFAARVPVIASRMGGLPEFVRGGHGGLTFDPGQPAQLTAILKDIATGGPEKLTELRSNIPAVRTPQEDYVYLEGVYEKLIRTLARDGDVRSQRS